MLRIQVSSARSPSRTARRARPGGRPGARSASAPRAGARARAGARTGSGTSSYSKTSARSSSRERRRARLPRGSASTTVTSTPGHAAANRPSASGKRLTATVVTDPDPQHRPGAVELAQIGLGLGEALEDRPRRARRAASRPGVSRTLFGPRSSSGTPASTSSLASCWETADGVKSSDSAAAAIEPRRATSRRTTQAPDVEHKHSLTTREGTRVVEAARGAGSVETCARSAGSATRSDSPRCGSRAARRPPCSPQPGVAAGAAMLATVLAGTVVARDQSVGRAVDDIPAAQRSVRAAWFGVAGPGRGPRSARPHVRRRTLAGVVPAAIRRPSSSSARARSPGRSSGSAPSTAWPTGSRSARAAFRAPASRSAARSSGCAATGRIPNVQGLRLVEVGTAVRHGRRSSSATSSPRPRTSRSRAALSPVYREAVGYHRPPPAPLVLAEGVDGLAALAASSRTSTAATPGSRRSRPGTVRAWEIDRSGRRRRAGPLRRSRRPRARSTLTAPVEELRAARRGEQRRGTTAPARRRRVGRAPLRLRRPGRSQHAPRHRELPGGG